MLEESLRVLLERTWPRLRSALPMAARFGAPWESLSKAFVERDADGRVIGHVGVMPVRLRLRGNLVRAAAVHAVCTDPGHRGRGIATALMQRALADCETSDLPVQILFAIDPGFYARLGFHSVSPRVFVAKSVPRHRPGPLERIDLASPAHLALVRRRLEARALRSHAFEVLEPDGLFLLDYALADGAVSLFHAPDWEIVIALRFEDRLLRIADVIGAVLPPMEEIVARIPGRPTGVVFERSCECMAGAATWVPEDVLIDDTMMVRGAWPTREFTFGISPLWRW